MSSKWARALPWAWLFFIATWAILSFCLPARPQAATPTMTYSGVLNVRVHGELHIVQVREVCTTPVCLDQESTVYYLTSENGPIQLMFGCAYPPCTLFGYVRIAQGVQLANGAEITAGGTLLVPSQWNSSNYLPKLQFIGDLYVLEIT